MIKQEPTCIEALNSQPSNQVRVMVSNCVFKSWSLPLMQSYIQEVTELHSSERENQMLTQQLTSREAELTRAEETINRQEQQIQEMRQRVSDRVVINNVCYDQRSSDGRKLRKIS